MLTLDASAACDVCADAYGPTVMPHSIPCGHSFCRTCLTTISTKNQPKAAVCPLCRESFDIHDIRVIRVDLSDPVPALNYDNVPFSDTDTDSDLSDRAARSPWNHETRIREEARQLELKVAKAASIKCTFEEVSDLHKEIQNWLLTDTRYKPAGKFAALRLSAALLRAILLNSVAFTDANRIARDKIASLESSNTVLEAESRRQKEQYGEKVHECQQLQLEIERIRRSPSTGFASLARSSPFPAPTTSAGPSPTNSGMSSPQPRMTPPSLASLALPSATQTPPPTPLGVRQPHTPTTHLPPRSVSTSPYGHSTPSTPSTISSPPMSAHHQRAHSLRSTQTSPVPLTAVQQAAYLRSTQTSPTPVVPNATRPSAVETLMYRPAPTIPRSMTAPLPPNPPSNVAPPPVRNSTKPRMAMRGAHERWVPVVEEQDETASDTATVGRVGIHAMNGGRARSNTIRAMRPLQA